MAFKRKLWMVEEEYSFWHLLPHDVLWMIIERLDPDLIECDYISAVCGNWRSGFKSYCTIIKPSFRLPKDTIPWLMTTRNNGTGIELYRPSTNKTYNIDFPEIYGTHCLYSKDGWLLLHKLEPRQCQYKNMKLCLINLFTRDKVELPELKTKNQNFITKGTFSSTYSNCPNCAIILTADVDMKVTLYAWKKGSDLWKRSKFDYDLMNAYNMLNIWLCDDQLYCFTTKGHCYAYDTDLNSTQTYPSNIDKLDNMTLCGNELFAFSVMDTAEVNVFKFFSCISRKDWFRISDVSNIIFFKNDDCISFMVMEECRSLLLKNLKKHGCQIKSSKKFNQKVVFEKETYLVCLDDVYHYNRSTRKLVKLKFNNLLSSSEREQQMNAKTELLVKKLRMLACDRTKEVPFIVCGTKTDSSSTWIYVG
ncbi:hypothetical protein FRX31_026588 [Thalictrum thalictroides]|uniref:KIB1-4 beta-propeller domain-containing protein n=1 Tax=Thalictrum thalictroides TaxID=46969 RepID=A0A7J6VFZ9_THATH|nr:hypothetical protein FRX31_026588 [Thalictrum thalictroides]